jgi:hypothetical protein
LHGGFLPARYCVNDVSTASPGNTHNAPSSAGTFTTPVNFPNSGTSSVDYPNIYFFVQDTTTTVDVSQKKIFQFGQSTPLTLTGFSNGAPTQQIVLLGNANVSIPNNASIKTASGATLQLEANKVYWFTNVGGIWYQDGSERDLKVNTLAVGAGSTMVKYYVVSGAITPASTAANTCAEQSFTPAAFNGVINAGDNIHINPSATMAANGVFPVLGERAVTNGVNITYCNSTAVALRAPAVTITVTGTR